MTIGENRAETSREHNSIWTESKVLNKYNIPGVSYPVLKQAVHSVSILMLPVSPL